VTIAPPPLLLAAFALAAPAPSAAAAPEREMLDAFRAACARTGDVEAMKTDAAASGWTEMAEETEPRVARLVRMGRDATGKDGTSTGAAYRRRLGGRDIFLIVSRYEDRTGFWGVGCRLYDFEATRPLEARLLDRWMGKRPTAVQEPAPGLSKRLWEPGWRDGVTLEVNHVPQNHPAGKTYGLSGNVLVAQAIGGF
jgi:hypothetical protein